MHIILASGSPRRKQLLTELGLNFEVRTKATPEDYPDDLAAEEIAELLAIRKAKAFEEELSDNQLVIAADTTVVLDGKLLEKAPDALQAAQMLRTLSGKTHQVITGVCLKSKLKTISFREYTKVIFNELSEKEIQYYIEKYKPFDKAGAYGIQEWIGMSCIKAIEGSYFNVVGLPTQAIYQKLKNEFGLF